MSEVTPNNLRSVILPKRLHRFLSSHCCKDSREPSKHEYLQLIDVFHPELCLPVELRKEDVIGLYDIIVSPFFSRKEVFNVDTYTFSYNPALQLLPQGQLSYPVKSLVLPTHLIKFMALDDPANEVEGTRHEYHEIINLFYPQLKLPLCLNKTQVLNLFNIAVLPFFQQLKDFDEDNGNLSYIPVQINPKKPLEKRRLRSIYLPQHLHCFLSYKDPAVTVVIDVTVDKILQILHLFYPTCQLSKGPCQCKGGWKGLFEALVLPFLRNMIAFDISTSIMRYVAVPLDLH